jgi:hypothetical protein
MPEDRENPESQSVPPPSVPPPSGHEPDTVPYGGVVAGAGGIVALVVISSLLMYAVFGFLAAHPTASPPPLSSIRESSSVTGPALSADQPSQLRALRAAEEAQLSTYSWEDQASGVARIPIERAMQILAQRGLNERGEGRAPLVAPDPTPETQQPESPKSETEKPKTQTPTRP